MNKEAIIQTLDYLNPSQIAGIGCLAFLAIREKSSLQHQREEMGFDDIPLNHLFYTEINDDPRLLEIAALIAQYLIENFIEEGEPIPDDN